MGNLCEGETPPPPMQRTRLGRGRLGRAAIGNAPPQTDGQLGRPSWQSRSTEVLRSVHRNDRVGRPNSPSRWTEQGQVGQPKSLSRSTEMAKGVGRRFKSSGGILTTLSPAVLPLTEAKNPPTSILIKSFRRTTMTQCRSAV